MPSLPASDDTDDSLQKRGKRKEKIGARITQAQSLIFLVLACVDTISGTAIETAM